MLRFLIALFAAIALLFAILLLAPQLVPTASYKGLIEDAATNALGRKVTLGDDISFKIIPTTAFRVTNLTIANEDGFEGDALAKVSEADVGVKLIPMLSRSVEINNFVLIDPEINLQRRADGAINWNLGAPIDGAATEEPSSSDGSSQELRDVKLGDVRIVNGRTTFNDAAAGQNYIAEDINLSVRLASFKEPLEADGSMTFQGAPASIRLVMTTIDNFLNEKPANVILDTTLGDATIGADLNVVNGETLNYDGPLSIDAPDLDALAALFGVELADAPGFDNLKIVGEADGDANEVRLRNSEIAFDAIDASGDMALNWAGAKPKATGSLQVGTMDLRPYMPPPNASAGGFPQWSDAPLDFTSLRNIDAEFDLSAKEVFLNDIKTGEARMALVVQNGRLSADIPQMQLYEGGGSGRLVVDASRRTPTLAGYFDFRSVQAQPMSADVLKHDNILGLGQVRLEFSGAGASQAAIMSSLDGEGSFDLSDGAIKGVNLVKIANAVHELYKGGITRPDAIQAAVAEARRANETTDFSKFLSEFTIQNGIAQAPKINLEGPFITMVGAGNLNLPGQTIDLSLNPRVTTTLDGEGGQAYSIPLRVGGTFASPTIGVDIDALLRGEVESRGLDLLDRVLGGNKEGEDGESGEGEEEDPAKTLLRGLFNNKPAPKDDGGQ